MPKSYKRKPLAAWPDDQKHQMGGENDDSGKLGSHDPDPEIIEEKDTLENAKDAGLYSDQDEEHPGELGVDQEEIKDQQYEKER